MPLSCLGGAQMLRLMQRLLADRKGGTAIEYGLIVAMIVIAMVVSLTQLADTTTALWGNVNNKIAAARSGQ